MAADPSLYEKGERRKEKGRGGRGWPETVR
jgi:hypothetical protein